MTAYILKKSKVSVYCTDYLNPFHAYDEGNLSWLVKFVLYSELVYMFVLLYLTIGKHSLVFLYFLD